MRRWGRGWLSRRSRCSVSELASGRLRDALAPVIELRALLALVHVHTRARTLNVLDSERKTVVRMSLEEPAVVASVSRHIPLRPRLRLAAVRGYADELGGVVHELTDTLGFRAADQPLVDEAVRAVGGVPGGISSKVELALAPTQRADGAAAAVLRALLEVIQANLEGAVAGIDSEFLHDFRVSVRRSRSVQREFKKVFPAALVVVLPGRVQVATAGHRRYARSRRLRAGVRRSGRARARGDTG